MNIFDSYIDAGQQLGKRDRERYYTALIEFLAYGIEPDVKGTAMAVIIAIRPSLDESRTRIVNGRKGGRPNKKLNGEIAESQTPETEKPNREKSEKLNGEIAESQTPETEKPKGKGKSKGKEELPNGSSKKSPRFQKPTADDVSAYASERGHPGFDAARFMDYYESNGWKVGRNPMRDWKATVRRWCRDECHEGGEYHGEYD
ncbi:DUF6291 domain-containing protein [Olsenella profusa]|uniref:Uncharacterized protein n=1 Tax=Olsenella profusa F0195 TaxID=1125712 RepID=U2TTY9_9ACTN|nr:DUF6291 domain-containing protein [Olsenella profusa]ERL09805.1 hypothetical protein HMPREF1316_1538 [Olsenella profusa F0195]